MSLQLSEEALAAFSRTPISPTALYRPRFGTMPEGYAPPERMELTEAEVHAVVAYENALYDMQLSPDQAEAGPTVGEVLGSFRMDDKQLPPVFSAALFAMRGQQVEHRKRQLTVPDFDTEADVRQWFAAQALDDSQASTLLDLALWSQGRFTASFTEAYSRGEEPSLPDALVLVNIEPAKSVDQFRNFMQARQRLLQERLLLRGDISPVAEGKRAWLDIYLGKLNYCIADYIPRMFAISDRSITVSEGYDRLVDELLDAMPKSFGEVALALASGDPMRSAQAHVKALRLMHRLDIFKNGLAFQPAPQDSGYDTARVDARLLGYRAEAGEQHDGLLTPAEIRYLHEAKITPEQSEQVLRKILDRYGFTDVPVAPNESKTTYSYDRKKKVFENTTVDRSLWELIDVGTHELEHVFQGVGDHALQDRYRFVRVSGRRSGGMREEGANARQYQVQSRLTGKSDFVPKLTYARALSVIAQGGTPTEAAQAFAGELRAHSQKSPADIGREAADRVIRLIRKGSNSQPLVYAEGFLLPDTLAVVQRRYPEVGSGLTVLDVSDQLRLARLGLLPRVERELDIDEHIKTVFAILRDVIPSFRDANIDVQRRIREAA